MLNLVLKFKELILQPICYTNCCTSRYARILKDEENQYNRGVPVFGRRPSSPPRNKLLTSAFYGISAGNAKLERVHRSVALRLDSSLERPARKHGYRGR